MKLVRPVSLLVAAFILAPTIASADGPEVFKAQKCTDCHSVSGAGISRSASPSETAPDLSKVGGKHDKRAIATYLLKKSEINGAKHKKTFSGSTDDLKAVAEWLGTLK